MASEKFNFITCKDGRRHRFPSLAHAQFTDFNMTLATYGDILRAGFLRVKPRCMVGRLQQPGTSLCTAKRYKRITREDTNTTPIYAFETSGILRTHCLFFSSSTMNFAKPFLDNFKPSLPSPI